MSTIEDIKAIVLDRAAKIYDEPEVYWKDTYQEGDKILRLVLVSPSFDSQDCEDADFRYSVRERLELHKILDQMDSYLVLVQPLAKKTFENFDRDVKEATKKNRRLKPTSQPTSASADEETSPVR